MQNLYGITLPFLYDCKTPAHLKTMCVEGRMREQLSELMEHSRDLSNVLVKSNLLKSLFSHPCSSDSLPSVNNHYVSAKMVCLLLVFGLRQGLLHLWTFPFSVPSAWNTLSQAHYSLSSGHSEISPHRNCLSFDLIYFVLKDNCKSWNLKLNQREIIMTKSTKQLLIYYRIFKSQLSAMD